jgi:hypothetical protein
LHQGLQAWIHRCHLEQELVEEHGLLAEGDYALVQREVPHEVLIFRLSFGEP